MNFKERLMGLKLNSDEGRVEFLNICGQIAGEYGRLVKTEYGGRFEVGGMVIIDGIRHHYSMHGFSDSFIGYGGKHFFLHSACEPTIELFTDSEGWLSNCTGSWAKARKGLAAIIDLLEGQEG